MDAANGRFAGNGSRSSSWQQRLPRLLSFLNFAPRIREESPTASAFASELLVDSATIQDLFGFAGVARLIAERVIKASKTQTPFTIGIYGAWGLGKTSLLRMIEEELRKTDISPIWFSAWRYDQEQNIRFALLQTILDQAKIAGSLPRRLWIRYQLWAHRLSLLAGFSGIAAGFFVIILRAAVALGILAFVIGVGIWFSAKYLPDIGVADRGSASWNAIRPGEPLFNVFGVVLAVAVIFMAAKPFDLLKIMSSRLGFDLSRFARKSSLRGQVAFLYDFSKELSVILRRIRGAKPLVLIIDDLDRCAPDKAIEILDTIKIFLELPGCVFLIACDHELIESAAFHSKFKNIIDQGGDESEKRRAVSLADAYLSKIIQLPINVPSVSPEQIGAFVTSICDDEDVRHCVQLFIVGLAPNPRSIKRFLQSFLYAKEVNTVLRPNESSFSPSLLIKLLLIESKCRPLYNRLREEGHIISEIEEYFRIQAATDEAKQIDSVVAGLAVQYAGEYAELPKLLKTRVDATDSFIDVDLKPYLYVLSRVADTVRPSSTSDGSERGPDLSRALNQLAFSDYLIPSSAMQSFIPPRFRPATGGPVLGLENFLQSSPRLMLFGAPGSGKTTMLQYVARELGVTAADIAPDNRAKFGLRHGVFPLYVQLREMVNDVNWSNLLDHLEGYFSSRYHDTPPKFVETVLRRGNCLVMLDGLDEVRLGETGQMKLSSEINSFARTFRANRFLITSRPSVQLADSFDSFFDRFSIEPFTASELREFLAKQIDDPTKLDALYQLLSAEEFPKSPLFAMMAAQVFNSTGAIPSTTDGIIGAIIDSSLSREEQKAGRFVLERSKLRKLLCDAAEYMQRNQLTMITKESLARLIVDELEPVAEVDDIIQMFVSRTGVLQEISPGQFGFVHKAIQEFLAEDAARLRTAPRAPLKGKRRSA